MNKFLQWLNSIKARFGGLSAIPPQDRNEGLSANARALLARSAPTEDVAALYQGTNVISRNVRDLSAGNKRAEDILNELVQWSPLLNEFDGTPRDKARALTFLAAFRDLQLEGNQIGALYDLCHQSPVKMLAVLMATKDPAKVDPATVQAAVATFGTRHAQNLPVNSLLQGVVDAMPQAVSGPQPDQEKEKQKGPPTYKFDDLMADLKSGKLKKELSEGPYQKGAGRATSVPQISFIEAGDTPAMVINKLSFGDEQARRILAQIASMAEMVDRDSVNGAMGPLMTLDTLGITGADVTSLHKACSSHASATVAVLRAHQLGFVSDEQIQKVASAKPGGNVLGADVRDLDVNGLILQVTEALPNFSYPAALMGGRQPGDLPPAGSGASGKPVPSVPIKKNLVQPPQPGQGKGGVADS